jgi:hypothetical protein
MRITSLVAAVVLLAASPVPGKAETYGLVPPAGEAIAPLPTDAAVRDGMVSIRDLVRTNHSLITHRRMPPDHAARFAKQVKAQADEILATSKVTGAARDKLKVLLGEIVGGIEEVAAPPSGGSAMDGLERADNALARYPAEFDHPGWVPVHALD